MSKYQAAVNTKTGESAVPEQRTAVRFASSSEASCRILSGSTLRDGRIHDLSGDGVGLLVDQRLEPGAFVALDLENPSRTFARTLVARVVHAKVSDSGSWLVGCTFIRKLEQGDLDLLSASADGRARIRSSCDLDASVQPSGSDAGSWIARVINISLGGIGLLSPRPVEKGKLLSVTLASGRNGSSVTVTARVVQRTVQVENQWPLGCEFLRKLTGDEIRRLLA
jgi:hypothetical protein